MNVTVRDLVVERGDGPVLEGVDLTADEESLVGIVGPNGAGKTTLLRTIAGTLDPASGSVAIGGDRVDALSSREASRRVAFLPQTAGITFDFTVREVVAMGRHPHVPRFGSDPAPDLVDRAIERAAVTDLADRPITEVSGGERQRVLLARAVAQDAPVLLLDEPTASLDINHQVRTFELVRDLVEEGRTALAAVHDLNLAARYCDHLVLLADGAVTASGPPERVLTADTLRAAFGARPRVTRDPVTRSPLVTALPDRDDPPGGEGHVHVLGGGEGAARVLYPLTAAGYQVSLGPVPRGDQALATAMALDCEALAVPPLSELSEADRRRARDRVASADATVLAGTGRADPPVLRDLTGASSTLVVVEPADASEDGEPNDRVSERGVTDAADADARVTHPTDVPEAVAAVARRQAPEPGD